MRCPLSLLSLLLPIVVATAADPPPLALSVTIPDVARTSRALADGPGRGLWTEAACTAWRQQLGRAGGVPGTR